MLCFVYWGVWDLLEACWQFGGRWIDCWFGLFDELVAVCWIFVADIFEIFEFDMFEAWKLDNLNCVMLIGSNEYMKLNYLYIFYVNWVFWHKTSLILIINYSYLFLSVWLVDFGFDKCLIHDIYGFDSAVHNWYLIHLLLYIILLYVML